MPIPAAHLTSVTWCETESHLKRRKSAAYGCREKILEEIRREPCLNKWKQQKQISARQLKYRSEKGGLCVFQLPADLKLSFGNRQSERCAAGGVQCRRTSSPGCHAYGFTLGDTRCVLMTSQTDQALIDRLIEAFHAEYQKLQQGGR